VQWRREFRYQLSGSGIWPLPMPPGTTGLVLRHADVPIFSTCITYLVPYHRSIYTYLRYVYDMVPYHVKSSRSQDAKVDLTAVHVRAGPSHPASLRARLQQSRRRWGRGGTRRRGLATDATQGPSSGVLTREARRGAIFCAR
jgi:hypothetical protein